MVLGVVKFVPLAVSLRVSKEERGGEEDRRRVAVNESGGFSSCSSTRELQRVRAPVFAVVLVARGGLEIRDDVL